MQGTSLQGARCLSLCPCPATLSLSFRDSGQWLLSGLLLSALRAMSSHASSVVKVSVHFPGAGSSPISPGRPVSVTDTPGTEDASCNAISWILCPPFQISLKISRDSAVARVAVHTGACCFAFLLWVAQRFSLNLSCYFLFDTCTTAMTMFILKRIYNAVFAWHWVKWGHVRRITCVKPWKTVVNQ